jgi:hypothetical protein
MKSTNSEGDMAFHKVKVCRGRDFEDGEHVVALTYLLPDCREGLVVFNQFEIMGHHLTAEDATDEQIIERVKAYTGGRPFIIDLLNDQHFNAANRIMRQWVSTMTPIYEGDMYLFGIAEE